jgi:hypothetical protein
LSMRRGSVVVVMVLVVLGAWSVESLCTVHCGSLPVTPRSLARSRRARFISLLLFCVR